MKYKIATVAGSQDVNLLTTDRKIRSMGESVLVNASLLKLKLNWYLIVVDKSFC